MFCCRLSISCSNCITLSSDNFNEETECVRIKERQNQRQMFRFFAGYFLDIRFTQIPTYQANKKRKLYEEPPFNSQKKRIQFISFVSCSSHPSLIVEFFHICPAIHSMLMLQTETQHKQTPYEFPLKLEHEITKEIPSSTKSNFEPSEKIK